MKCQDSAALLEQFLTTVVGYWYEEACTWNVLNCATAIITYMYVCVELQLCSPVLILFSYCFIKLTLNVVEPVSCFCYVETDRLGKRVEFIMHVPVCEHVQGV